MATATGACFAFRPRLGLMLGVSDILDSTTLTSRSRAGEESGSSSSDLFSLFGTLLLTGIALPASNTSLRDSEQILAISSKLALTFGADDLVPAASFASSSFACNR